MKRGDRVRIKRGNSRGHKGTIAQVIDPGYGGGPRVVVAVDGNRGGVNLAASSVEPVAA